ncbi:MAG TPA: amidohydrolase [Anaerolineaceae bacterium]
MLVLYNAQIYNPSLPQNAVTALAIDHGKIIAAGSNENILAEFSSCPHKENMSGKFILPGLTDAHIHLEHFSHSQTLIDCETTTLDETLKRLADRVKVTPPGMWIRGHGWNQNLWAGGFGNAEMLDQIAPRNPVYLTAKSLHASWANSSALTIAGINSQTPDPTGGQIQRTPNGEPTGILFESAMRLVEEVIPEQTLDETIKNLAAAQKILWEMGITAVHDFDGARCFSALQVLDSEKQLHLRVLKAIREEMLEPALEIGLRSGFGSDFLRMGSLKLFMDGALGPQTAAMLEPYEGTNQKGILLLNSDSLFEYGQKAARGGFGLAVHAIGDAANRAALDGFTRLRKFEQSEHLPTLRHRIEHVQLLHPADKARLARLQVIASMQPIHATSDKDMAERHWGKRSELAYAWQTIRESGAPYAFGSDAPVETPNPFIGLHAAVTRCRSGETLDHAWYPTERLNLADAIAGFTTGAAYAAGWEDWQGKLQPGYAADLILLDQNIFEISPNDLPGIKPIGTMVAGQWVWR